MQSGKPQFDSCAPKTPGSGLDFSKLDAEAPQFDLLGPRALMFPSRVLIKSHNFAPGSLYGPANLRHHQHAIGQDHLEQGNHSSSQRSEEAQS